MTCKTGRASPHEAYRKLKALDATISKRPKKLLNIDANAQLADAQSLNARSRAEAASSRIRTGAGQLRGRLTPPTGGLAAPAYVSHPCVSAQ